MVEDNRSDVFLVQEALRTYGLAARLEVIQDGVDAIEWIRQNDHTPHKQQPSAILLNLNLPGETGEQVLNQICVSSRLQSIPVILFTASNSYRDRSLRDRRPGIFYFQKSSDIDELMGVANLLQNMIVIERAAPEEAHG
jgi:CheY-like chemotaxis protein